MLHKYATPNQIETRKSSKITELMTFRQCCLAPLPPHSPLYNYNATGQ